MDWTDALTIIGGVLGIVATAYGVARFVLREKGRQLELERQISALQERNRLLTSTVANSAVKYDELKELSSNAQLAIGADHHSISVPIPKASPKYLQIIISTDANAEKILGKEFSITKGIAGKVFHSQKPEYVNKAAEHPKHFNLIDKAAGTNTGQGAILTMALASQGASRGIIQFMKKPGGKFSMDEIRIAERFVSPITDLLVDLQDRKEHDIPYGTRADESYVTVCFTDINDYSTIAKEMGLHQSVELLNEYYRRLVAHAVEHDAILEEYLGDGVYLSFRRESQAEAATLALECSLKMQSTFDDLLHEWRAYEYHITDSNYHNVGVASGGVHEGLVGHPMHRRRKLIGRTVDTAAHLVEEGKKYGPCILVSESTRDLVSESDFQFEDIDSSSFRCFKLRQMT